MLTWYLLWIAYFYNHSSYVTFKDKSHIYQYSSHILKFYSHINFNHYITLVWFNRIISPVERIFSKCISIVYNSVMYSEHHRVEHNICKGVMFVMHAVLWVPLMSLSPPVKTEWTTDPSSLHKTNKIRCALLNRNPHGIERLSWGQITSNNPCVP